jgi:hypothetical protein
MSYNKARHIGRQTAAFAALFGASALKRYVSEKP